MPIPSRGLRDIPTYRARTQSELPAYCVYMRIACIEMEKGRRGLERQAARRRVANADERLADLEREKAELMTALGAGRAAGAADTPPPAAAAGFRIKY